MTGADQRGEDAADLVERWMRAQLILEREYFRAVDRAASRQERLLTLLEMDIITQLPEEGASFAAIASNHNVSPAELRLPIQRLVRRGMLERRRQGRSSLLLRTAAADRVIRLILSTQADMMASVLNRLSPEVQSGLLSLMETGALVPDSQRGGARRE